MFVSFVCVRVSTYWSSICSRCFSVSHIWTLQIWLFEPTMLFYRPAYVLRPGANGLTGVFGQVGVTSRSGPGALGRWRPKKWTAAGVVTDCGFEPSIWWIHVSGTPRLHLLPLLGGGDRGEWCPHIADVLPSARNQPLLPPKHPARWQQRLSASYATQLHYDELN